MKKKKTDKSDKPFGKTQDKPTNAGEPRPAYGSGDMDKTIRFFNSFEEMNEFDHMEMAKSTPIERLQHITQLLNHSYATELIKDMDLTIYLK